MSDRFSVSKSILFTDNFMACFIKIGGIGIIGAVCGIFIFIFINVLPLFQGANIEEIQDISVPEQEYLALGVDQWGELPFLMDKDYRLHFFDVEHARDIPSISIEFSDHTPITQARYNQRNQVFAIGTAEGYCAIGKLTYKKEFLDDTYQIIPSLKIGKRYSVGEYQAPIVAIGYADSGKKKAFVVMQRVAGSLRVSIITLRQKLTLLGAGKIKVDKRFDITPEIQGEPVAVRINSTAEVVLVTTTDGKVYYFMLDQGQCRLTQVFQPFSDLKDSSIHSLNFLLGGVSVLCNAPSGKNRVFSLFIPEANEQRLFGQTKEFPSLPGEERIYATSMRNKAFLTGSRHLLSLRYATTETIRWQQSFKAELRHAIINGKYDRIFVLDNDFRMKIFRLDDPHPESSFNAYFSKIWYEGASRPSYEWQSTGGTDDYEPKLSLIPLIVGTLKGTFYAMLFATPIALFASLYTSQFLHWRMRSFVKPIMETMASLPSVVLGFLAALWLAPLIEGHIVFILLSIVLLPVVTMTVGAFWEYVPFTYRRFFDNGKEFIPVLVLIVITMTGCFLVAPFVEQLFFVSMDPTTNQPIADFRVWWRQTLNLPFEQRNALVVGFAMGFAVVPIIFSIAEESISNVPKNLLSSALALGASHWQAAVKVILPTASPGIFSALMIGFGRAVGETMIVLMATGNTPIMELNIFTGMRTLSANIAVELPEAPYEGTLYRTLFLGALLLFIFTFLINSIAEVLRNYLRNKYKVV